MFYCTQHVAVNELKVTPLATPPAVIPKKGRNTNQLQFLLKNIVRTLWRHHYAWPFLKPVDPVALRIPVSFLMISQSIILYGLMQHIHAHVTCY